MWLVHGMYLGGMLLAIALGAVLGSSLLKRPLTSAWASAASAGILLGICFLCLLPEAYELFLHESATPLRLMGLSVDGHVWIGGATALGFLSLLSIERLLFATHTHSSCASHDAHNHHAELTHHAHEKSMPHDTHERSAAWSLLFTLCLHSLFDGIGLRTAEGLSQLGWVLAGSLLLHKIPETASLLTVLQRAHIRRTGQLWALGLYTAATALGMLAADRLHRLLASRGSAILMAFSAGALLHLVTGHLLPESIQPPQQRTRLGTYQIMLLGFLVILVARLMGHP